MIPFPTLATMRITPGAYMNDRILETLMCRLDRLERQVRWWKVVGSAAVGILGFVVLIGATAQRVPDEIKANRVVIVDDTGKPRIVLGKGEDGKDDRYEISLANKKGAPTVVLYVYDSSERLTISGLNLRDIKGKEHVELQTRSTPESDHASLWLRGEIQEIPAPLFPSETSPQEIKLAVTSDRSPFTRPGGAYSSASFTLRTDRVSADFWVNSEDASLSFSNYAGPPPVVALDNQKGRLSLGMYEGRPTLRMGDNVIGMPGLVLGNASFSSQSGTTMKLPAASLIMLDKDGKILWKAPR
jgi:hypothetical protein